MMNEHEMKARFYMDRKIEVHIEMKFNSHRLHKTFYNGKIISVEKDFLIFVDRVFGEIPIFFHELVLIEPYKQRGEK